MGLTVTKSFNKSYSKYATIFFEDKVSICPHLPEETQKFIKLAIKEGNFTGKKEEIFKISYLSKEEVINLIYIGAGKEEEFQKDEYRDTLYKTLSTLKGQGEISLFSPSAALNNPIIIAEVVKKINYSFEKYKEEKEKKVEISLFNENPENINEIISICDSIDFTKDLINEQASVMTPEMLGIKAKELRAIEGLEVEVLNEYEIEALGMEAFLSVGKGSTNKPRLIIMRYMGDSTSQYKYGLVGKGITFDTGGLCLKPADSMIGMKDDMGEAATVMGAMRALALNKIKKNITAVIPACENAIGPLAYRPSDIIKTMSGKYIEVTNTDAEGRIILADAITYAIKKEGVSEIVDIATLTGAIVVALGESITGAFSNKKDAMDKMKRAFEDSGELIWEMPIAKEHRVAMKSYIADIRNSSGKRWGGASTAAAFLEVFVEGKTWIHLDIAGTVMSDGDSLNKKGATGVGVKSLYYYIK